MHLFFGCRHEHRDFLYRDELQRLETDGTLSRLFTAFSRDSDAKVYVQQRMLEWGEQLCDLLLVKKGHLFVCGDGAQMANDVNAAIVSIISSVRQVDETTARKCVAALKVEGRYRTEVWS